MFGGPYWTRFSIEPYHILQACWDGMDEDYKHFSQIERQISELLGLKILDIPHQLWTAYLSQIRPSRMGMKLMPDERPRAMGH